MSSSSLSKCLICFSSFCSTPSTNPEHFKFIFNAFCKLMKINIIEPMSWDFEKDDLPFCQLCFTVLEKVQKLYDHVESIQLELDSVFNSTKVTILKSESDSCGNSSSGENTNTMNALRAIDRVKYVRNLIIRDASGEGNIMEKLEDLATTPDPTVVVKVEAEGEDEFLFVDEINDTCEFNFEKSTHSFDGVRNVNRNGEDCRQGSSIQVDVECDPASVFPYMEDCDSSVHSSNIKSKVETVADAEDSFNLNCHICEKTFRRKGTLQLHLERHLNKSDKKPMHEEFNETVDNINHPNFEETQVPENNIPGSIKSQSAQYICPVCSKEFPTFQHLGSHTRSHLGARPFKCAFPLCTKTFVSSVGLRKHQGCHKYICSTCSKTFSSNSMLQRHIEVMHETEKIKPGILNKIRTSEKPFKCEFCDKAFTDYSSLTRHTGGHTGIRPYECTYCDKSFRDSSDLMRHTRIHTGEKPYKCENCEKTFRDSSSLVKHRRTHTGEKPYKCKFCEKSFINSGDLVCHTRIHTGEKPFKCDICQKCFVHVTSLKSHLKSHERTFILSQQLELSSTL